jgi:hypothetical protein
LWVTGSYDGTVVEGTASVGLGFWCWEYEYTGDVFVQVFVIPGGSDWGSGFLTAGATAYVYPGSSYGLYPVDGHAWVSTLWGDEYYATSYAVDVPEQWWTDPPGAGQEAPGDNTTFLVNTGQPGLVHIYASLGVGQQPAQAMVEIQSPPPASFSLQLRDVTFFGDHDLVRDVSGGYVQVPTDAPVWVASSTPQQIGEVAYTAGSQVRRARHL